MCHEPTSFALGRSIGIGKGSAQMADFALADVILVGGPPDAGSPLFCRISVRPAQEEADRVSISCRWGTPGIVALIKSLWASVQGDPVFMRRVNGWFTIFWIVMIPVSLVTGWISSVSYVAALSLWALVSGHWSAWQAARVEVTQQAEEAERQANPVEERVVDKLVQSTTVEAV
jgi:hypothetical protein